jgi:inhibitor of cysteine peptidase
VEIAALSRGDNGKLVTVTRGDTVEIVLPENPTTGYRWAVESVDAKVLQLRNSSYSVNTGGGIGGGGIRKMTFEAKTSGRTDIRLKLRREWDRDASAIDHFSVSIDVRER